MNTEREPTFFLIADLAVSVGAAPIKDKIWTHKVDEHWEIAVNGKDHTAETAPFGQSQLPIKIQPFHCYVEFNGWPAGILSPHGGTFAAGSLANIEEFDKALLAATERAKA